MSIKFRSSGSKQDELFKFAQEGNLEQVRKLIEVDGVNAGCLDEDERTPLHWAAAKDKRDIVQYLVKECNQDVNTKDDGGWSPLLSAASSSFVHMVALLLQNSADPNSMNDSKRTALHYASSKGRTDIVDLLLNYGAKNRKDETGAAPIHRAAAAPNGAAATVERLLKSDANINSTNSNGDTAAHIAAEYGNEDVMDVLLKNGADMTIENNEHKTPLQLASSGSMKYLITSYKQ
ncbi:hypothetical protein CYY_010191 [Polysphondylium violaceum]|uniref:Ankyrin repeat-containing protein n=1 Tax=Polysphondylium violaceum TaxID=133409 RepID=A0A8J4PLR6_9MYCE|nr:hypothetical protein CYY_010191 [Polysphondylium violaceum]